MGRAWTISVALGLFLLVVPGAQAGDPGDFLGANVQPLVKLQVAGPDRWDAFLSRQAADGLGLARADAAWVWAEPTAPVGGVHTYSWDRPDSPQRSLDRVVGALARNGLRMVAVITMAPGWAGGAGREVTPEHYGDMAAFAGAFAARYGSSGSYWDEHPQVPRLPVRDYELWTEGNSTNSWSRRSDAAEYVAGMRPVSAAVHAADPGGRVLASVGWEEAPPYVSALYAAGVKGVIDGIAFHPYGFRAVDIFGLVRGVRGALVAAGDGALPIDVTEVGFPAKTPAVDATRAGTLSLAGEALARSDCGIGDFLVYANVGSESGAEQIDEGFMGIYRLADVSPTLTATALAAVAGRMQADPSANIVVCGGGVTPTTALLPLSLDVSHDKARCVTGHVTYAGSPLRGAQVVLRSSRGTVATQETDEAGAARACVPSGGADKQFTVQAQLANVAVSGIETCAVGHGGCSSALAPSAQGGSPAAASCRYRLRARIVRVGRARTTARVRIACRGRAVRNLRVSVYRQRKGSRHLQRLTRVTVRVGKVRSLRARGRLRAGDRLVLRRARSGAVPRLQAVLVATRKLGAR